MRRRFFVERFDGGVAMLRGETARHLGTVLRAEPGQQFELSDGTELWLGEIREVGRDSVKFSLIEKMAAPTARARTELLLAIVKFDRFEWAIEKATELGVGTIVPVAAARSENGLIAAAVKRAARWQKILIESAQQSRRLGAPVLAPVAKLKDAFANAAGADVARVMLSENVEAAPLKQVLSGHSETVSRVVLAIGPEGGWTPAELEIASAAQFRAASLGSLILRTETAVIAALASINYALGA